MTNKTSGIILGTLIFLFGAVGLALINWKLAIFVFSMIWGNEIVVIMKGKDY